jgi:hypothetical protein
MCSSGGTALNKVTVTLRNPLNREDTLDYIINVYDTPLGKLWYAALQDILLRNLYLEKNFCFLGFPDSARNLEYICKELTWAKNEINRCFTGQYVIEETFSPSTLQIGIHPNQDLLNSLHNHFENLQGTVWNLSEYYKLADYTTKFAIRQLNNLCHEAESLMLSQRKQATQPEWVRPSQITTFLNAKRLEFPTEHKTTFDESRYDRKFGEVYLHWTQIGKTLYEVYRDEKGVDIDLATCDAITHLRYYSGEFDVEWAQDVVFDGPHPWHSREMLGFREWLQRNSFDLNDAEYNYGYHSVGQVDLMTSFGTNNYKEVWPILSKYLDIYAISCDSDQGSLLQSVYPYTWTDADYFHQQIEKLKPGYDYSSRR